jgi:hypothetical protein
MNSTPSKGYVPIIGHPWWEARRFRYNVALILAGLLAAALSIGATMVFEDRIGIDEFEVTAFTIGFQVLAYGIAMLLANLCYLLGPLGERLVEPAHRPSYRARAFVSGLSFRSLSPCFCHC